MKSRSCRPIRNSAGDLPLAGVSVLRVPVLEDGSGELCRVELAGNGDIVSDHPLHGPDPDFSSAISVWVSYRRDSVLYPVLLHELLDGVGDVVLGPVRRDGLGDAVVLGQLGEDLT